MKIPFGESRKYLLMDQSLTGSTSFKNICLFLFLAVLGLHCYAQALSSYSELHELLVVVASLVEHGLWRAGSVVGSGFSCPAACGILLYQG